MSFAAHLRTFVRPLIEYHVLFSFALARTAGVALQSLYLFEEKIPSLSCWHSCGPAA